MEFQAVPDLVQMSALQGAALLLLHGVMLACGVGLSLLCLLCLFDSWQGRPLQTSGASKDQRRAPSLPALPLRAEIGTACRAGSRVIGSPGPVREEPQAALITLSL